MVLQPHCTVFVAVMPQLPPITGNRDGERGMFKVKDTGRDGGFDVMRDGGGGTDRLNGGMSEGENAGVCQK